MSCGCEVGSVFALATLIAMLGHLVAGTGNPVGWGTAAWVGGWVISSAVVGKLIGLGYARIRVVQLRAQLCHLRAQVCCEGDQHLDDVTVAAEPGRVCANQLAGLPASPPKEY